jgi:F-type H+-transporting ATPase subunit delta
MSGIHMAVRYAEALYEVAVENDALDAVLADMKFIGSLLADSPDIRNYCRRERVGGGQEAEFIEIAFLPYVSEYTGNMLQVAAANGRLSAIPLIPEAFAKIHEKRAGITKVVLETAHTPDAELLEIVKQRMAARTGRKIVVEQKLVPELMGGFRIWYDGHLIDSSVMGRLVRMRRVLETF